MTSAADCAQAENRRYRESSADHTKIRELQTGQKCRLIMFD